MSGNKKLEQGSYLEVEDKIYKLPDISYDQFLAQGNWTGSSDTAYAEYLRKNNMHEIWDFNEETLRETTLIFVSPIGEQYRFKYQPQAE